MIIKFLLFAFVFAFYVYNSAPTVSSGDSGEFCGVVPNLGIAHPPGYPTYVIFGKIINTLLPFGTDAYKTNIFSCICAALTVFIFSLISPCYFYIPFAVSACFLKQAIVAEVFALNILITVILFMLFKKFVETNYKPLLFLFALIYGIGLGNHHMLVLIIIPFILWYFIHTKKLPSVKELCQVILFTFIGLSIYLHLPIRSLTQPLYDWEDPETLSRFIFVITRGRYGTFQLAQGTPLPISLHFILSQFKTFIAFIAENYTLIGGLFILVAFVITFLNNLKKFFLFLSFIFFSGPFFLILMRTYVVSEHMKFIVERFIPFSFVFLIFLINAAFENKKKIRKILNLCFIFLGIYLFSHNLNVTKRHQFIYYDYTINLLKIPPNSILFSDRADEMDFCLPYFLFIQKYKNDVEFIDCNAGVTRSIYGNDYYRIWGIPRLEIRSNVESEIISKTTKNVFYTTFLPEQTSTQKIPYGLLYISKPLIKKYFPWHEILILRKPNLTHTREKNLFLSHFELLFNYYLSIRDITSANIMANYIKTYESLRIHHIAYQYFNSGFYEEAKNKYISILNLNPNDKEALCNLGVIYEKTNELDMAIKYFKKVLSIDPSYESAYFNMSVVYWKKNDWKNVVECLENVLRINPHNNEARRYLEIAKKRL